MNLRILYIVSRPLEINSSASQRNINTINGLDNLGNSVTVVTGRPNKNHPQYSNIKLNDGVKLLYTSENLMKSTSAKMSHSSLLQKIRSFVYRFYSKNNVYDSWKYVVNDKVWSELCYDEFDVVISSADPKSSHLAAEKIIDKYNLPWVQIWGDPFTGDITCTNKKLELERKKEEERFIKKATKVAYLSELTALEMCEKYPEYKEKIKFMPRPYLKTNIYESNICNGESLKIAYCGDYASNVRNIKPLYDAILKAEDNMIICGNSDVRLNSTEKIQVIGRVSTDEVCRIEEKADVLIHLSNLKGFQIPGKIYNYSATNKPVLFILDGEKDKIKKCFEKYNRFMFCNNNSSEIVEALNLIRNGKYPAKLEPVADFMSKTVLENLLNI